MFSFNTCKYAFCDLCIGFNAQKSQNALSIIMHNIPDVPTYPFIVNFRNLCAPTTYECRDSNEILALNTDYLLIIE